MTDRTPTKAQRKALEFAKSDGALSIGGIDGRPIRLSVALRCKEYGWLEISHTPIPYMNWWDFKLTQKGKEVLR